MTQLSPHFWQDKFETQQTGWDRGQASPQLLQWLECGALNPRNTRRIAVPGCGKGWEVAALSQAGFETTGIDYTPAAVAEAQQRLQAAGLSAEVLLADVLTYTPEQPFDAVYEQTCLCALTPDAWIAYSQQLVSWIRPGGRLYALFMQVSRPASQQGLVQGPPFHCDINAMHALFGQRHWRWPTGALTQVPHRNGLFELAVVLDRI
ncbi:MAG: methyltransferase domain-containing protein [Fluviibacter sp.]